MFKLKDIKEAHALVKTGADFPNYIQALNKLGVMKYDTYVSDGHTIYFGAEDFQIKAKPKYAKLTIANISDKDRFKHFLKNHQRGQTDFPTFTMQAAQSGVLKWTMDLLEMSCTYYDKANEIMLTEQIPSPL